MQLATMHPEDIKAGLRKRFGTVFAFEQANGLPKRSVADVLRGRPNARVIKAIEDALNLPAPDSNQSNLSDSSEIDGGTHRLISVGR
jgi:lambda repressor-like predicted transcriptional regulator